MWILLRIVGGIVLTVLGVLALAMAAMQLPAVRSKVRDELVALAQQSLRGELEVGDLRLPSVRDIELDDLLLRGEDGSTVASVEHASLRFDPTALLSGAVRIEQVTVKGASLSLGRLDTQEGGLFDVLPAADEPAADEKEEPPPQAGGFPSQVVVEEICIRNSQLTAQTGPQARFGLRDLDTCASIRMGSQGRLAIELDSLAGVAEHNGERIARLLVEKDLPPRDAGGAKTTAVAIKGSLELDPAPAAVDARVVIRDLAPHTLAALGVDPGALPPTLHGIDAELTAQGPVSDLRYRLDIGHPQSDQPAPTSARLDGTLQWAADTGELELQSELHAARYDGVALPRASLRLELPGSGAIYLEQLRLTQGSAKLQAQAELMANGAIQADVSISAPRVGEIPAIERLLPELSAALTVDLHVERSAELRWSGRLDATAKGFALAEQRAERIQAEVRLQSLLPSPELQATLSARGLQLDGAAVSQARVHVEGGPQRYQISGSADDRLLDVKGWVARSPAGEDQWEAAGRVVVQTDHGPIAARVARLRFDPGQALHVSALRLRFHEARARVEGTLGLGDQASRLTVRGRVPELGELTQRFADTRVPGQLAFQARLRGQIDQPVVQLSADYRNGVRFDDEPIRVRLEAGLNQPRNRVHARLTAQGVEGGSAAFEIEGRPRGGALDVAALEHGRYQASLTIDRLSLGALGRSLPPGSLPLLDSMAGMASLRLDASGRISDPTVTLALDSRLQFTRDEAPIELTLAAQYEDSELEGTLGVEDRRGPLLKASVDTEVRRALLARGLENVDEVLTQSRWNVEVDVASRRLWNLPGARIAGEEQALLPWQVALEMKLSHEPGAEPTGHLRGQAQWLPAALPAGEDAVCASRTPLRAHFEANMSRGRLNSEVQASVGGEQAVSLYSSTRAPLDRWLQPSQMAMGPARIEAQIRGLDVERVPFLCEHARGVISADLRASELFDQGADFALNAHVASFRWDEGPLFDANVQARSAGNMLQVDATAKLPSAEGRAEVKGLLPITFRVDSPELCMHDEKPLDVRVRLSHMDVQPLLVLVPGVARPSGQVDGAIRISGSLAEPRADGALELSQVSFTLADLGQRFSDINAQAVLDGRTVRIPRARFEAREGWAKLSAEATLASAENWFAELDLHTEDFPIRNQGIYLGQTDAQVQVTARADPQRILIDADIEELSVELTTQGIEGVQSLEPNPDIVFVHGEEEEEQEVDADPAQAREVVILINTERPAWIRRDDFALQASADLTLRPGSGGAYITGAIEVHRGFVQLFGQSFDVQRGLVTFTGGERVDPQLEITATHDNPGGGVTRVEVTGFVQAPELAFYVDNELVNAGEALAAMTGRGGTGTTGDEQSAQAQLSSMAMGMTLGLLSLGARRQLGDWVPVLSVQQAEDETRVTAGLEADRIIPNFLRGFVRGAYVEGIVSARRDDDDGGAQGPATASGASGGVLLELLLPRDLVWALQYGPGPRWSVDLDWRP